MTEILPPFGTNPPAAVIGAGVSLDQRYIHNDPRELWYLALPSKLTPAQVLQILRAAIGGDLWQAWQLVSLMMDSWPRLRKCAHELREPVSQAKYKINPCTQDGEEPTATASEKAALVKRAFEAFQPNAFTDEEGLQGAIYDFTDSVLIGMTMSEILWQTVKTKEHGVERYPKSICWVHPRHYTFGTNGVVALFDDNFARQYYNLASPTEATTPDPRKFICSQFKSRSGSALGAGLMRPLAWFWSGFVFGREWRLKNAQVFGAPFVDVTYKPGTTPTELAKLDAEISAGLANRFIRHIEGTTVNVHPGQPTGSSNSQKELMDDADRACTELLLGQEGTTKSQPGSLGGNDDSKSETKRERIEGLAKWTAQGPLMQLARAILLANYGECSECPMIEADFTEIQDPMVAAQRMQIVCGPNMPPIVADDFYSAMKLNKPEPGDQVISAGRIGLLGDTEQEIDPNPQEQMPDFDEQGNPLNGDPDGPAPVQARSLKAVLSKASDKDLMELEELVHAAEHSSHRNGNHTAVKAKLVEITKRRL